MREKPLLGRHSPSLGNAKRDVVSVELPSPHPVLSRDTSPPRRRFISGKNSFSHKDIPGEKRKTFYFRDGKILLHPPPPLPFLEDDHVTEKGLFDHGWREGGGVL